MNIAEYIQLDADELLTELGRLLPVVELEAMPSCPNRLRARAATWLAMNNGQIQHRCSSDARIAALVRDDRGRAKPWR